MASAAKSIDLSNMSAAELKSLRKKVDSAIQKAETRQKTEALKAAEAAAAQFGFSLKDLNVSRSAGAPAKYRNPTDANQTWSGRGRQPQWFKDALSAGKDPADMEI